MQPSSPNRLRTHYDHPPIPDRSQDWSAWFDGQEERATGRGATENAALRDLIERTRKKAAVSELALHCGPTQEKGTSNPQARERIAR